MRLRTSAKATSLSAIPFRYPPLSSKYDDAKSPGKANSVGFPIVKAFEKFKPFDAKLSKNGLTQDKLPPTPVLLGIKASTSTIIMFFFRNLKKEVLLLIRTTANRIPNQLQTTCLKLEPLQFLDQVLSSFATKSSYPLSRWNH